MNNLERITEIRQRLETALSPTFLDVIDDSAEHVGHAGAQSGAGHFTVRITADELANCSKVEAHKRIYQPLGDLIPNEIHALSIDIV